MRMGFLDRPAAALAWLGRHGTNAVAISILLGIALPPLGALIRPFFPETVFLLLCLAFLRVDPGALRAQFAKPRLLLAAAVWTMLIVPVLAGSSLSAFDLFDRSPGAAAGADAQCGRAADLRVARARRADGPQRRRDAGAAARLHRGDAVPAPALVALFVGPAVTFSPLALGLRLVLMLAGAACVGIASAPSPASPGSSAKPNASTG